MATCASASRGNALVMVLVTIAILLLAITEISGRAVREMRIVRVRTATEQAYYAAEAGFNRIAAQISRTGSVRSGYLDPIDPTQPHSTTENLTTLVDGEPVVVGGYTITVSKVANNVYHVVSQGWEQGQEAKRYIAGTITNYGTRKIGTQTYYRVHIVYDP